MAASILALAFAACGDTTPDDRLADDTDADDMAQGTSPDALPGPDTGPTTTPAPPPTVTDDVADADDTAQNADDAGMTPTDQSSDPKDLEITRQIREKIVAGKGDPFSTDAQNVKVVTNDGVVTLRGPVETEREKEAIASIARETDGVKRVDDQLEVASR
jgi:hypothetical protein